MDSQTLLTKFWVLWASQVCSLLGTDLTQFGLRLWAYKHSQNLSQFTWVTFFAEVVLIFLTIRGRFAIICSCRRRRCCSLLSLDWLSTSFHGNTVVGLLLSLFFLISISVMLASDTISMLANLCLLWLYRYGPLTIDSLFITTVVQSICNAFHWPAFVSTTTLLLPKDKLVQYGALSEVVPAIVMMLAPMIAAFILSICNDELHVLFAIEFVTFVAAFVTMLSLQIPNPSSKMGIELPNSVHDISEPFRFIYERPALCLLMSYLFLSSFISGINQVLATPLLLSFSDAKSLGLVITISGIGGIVGGITLSVFGGPKSDLAGVLTATAIQGILLSISGLAPSSILQGCVGFLYTVFLPMLRQCRVSIFQRKTPAAMQGRIFSLQRATKQLAMPLAAIVSGFLADYCERLLQDGDAYLASTIGAAIGVGKGRGIAFLFMNLGAFIAIVSSLGFLYKPLRLVETQLPDQDHLAKKLD